MKSSKVSSSSSDKISFSKSLQGKSISQRTRLKANYIISQKRNQLRDVSSEETFADSHIQIFKDDETFEKIRSYKPLDNKVSIVNVFQTETDSLVDIKKPTIYEKEAEINYEDENFHESNTNEVKEQDAQSKSNTIGDTSSLLPAGEGHVTMMSEYNDLLPSIETKKLGLYFGNEAKTSWSDTYRELDRRRKILWADGGDSTEDVLIKTITASRAASPFTSSVAQLCQSGILNPLGSRGSRRNSNSVLNSERSNFSFNIVEHNTSLNLEGVASITNHEMSHRSMDLDSHRSFGSNGVQAPQSLNQAAKSSSFASSSLATSKSIEDIPVLELNTLDLNTLSAAHNNDVFPAETEDDFFPSSSYDQMSPRATFLAGCLKLGLPPRSSAMIRKRLSTKLSLNNQGIGDNVALALASALKDVPFISSLDLSDNNLTDKSMRALFEAIQYNPNIKDIDFSRNDIDSESAAGLSTYLASRSCALRKLTLQAADLDDSETNAFVQSLMKNTTLEELDLSQNLIGKDETLNAVKPDTVTGGESLANLMRADTSGLKTLKVAWNMIRLDSAVDLCDSISFNQTLTYLDLSYNSIGNEGGTTLGRALLTNKVLKELHVKNNMIDPVACFTISVGARETLSLRFINIDGNPIGEAGGRALMTIPLVCGARLAFSACECDFQLKSNKIILNRRDPVGKYELNMSSDYGRAVLFDILDIVANHPSLIISSYSLSKDEGVKWEGLSFKKFAAKKPFLTAREKNEIDRLAYIIEVSQNEKLIEDLFLKYDQDGSGELDLQEFLILMSEFGITLTEKEGKAIISSVDLDGGGLLELTEIIAYVRQLASECPSKIYNIENRFAMSLAKSEPPERYFPPTTGRVRIQILDSFIASADSVALTKIQCLDMIDASKNSSNSVALLTFGSENVRLCVEEAEMIHRDVAIQTGNPIVVLSKLMPMVSSVFDARRLLNSIVGDSQSKTLYLKQLLGPSFRPLLGIFDGFYCLDLSIENDRICLSKLFEQNNTITASRKSAQQWDVSQDGNWSSFRNEVRSGSNASICVENFTPIPKRGFLEFDFSGSNRPIPRYDIPISNKKFLHILVKKLQLLDKDHHEWALNFLKELEYAERKTISGQGYSYWHPDFARAKAVSERVNYLYERLALRKVQYMKALRLEFIAFDVRAGQSLEENSTNLGPGSKSSQPVETATTAVAQGASIGSNVGNDDASELSGEEDGDEQSLLEAGGGSLAGHIEGEETSVAGQSQVSEQENDFSKLINYGSHDTIADRLNAIFAHGGVAKQAICVCIMEYVETFMSTRWIKCSHLALLLTCFRDGLATRTEFGSYRVELIILMFTRLLDVHNFEFVLMVLTADEHAAILARIGNLNLFNPWKPEGAYQLDLSRFEEKQIVRMLAHLSIIEPGENWIRCEFSQQRGIAHQPGWTLNVVWFTEEGFPKAGVITVHQFSGDGLFRKGCHVDLDLRAGLLALVLINSSDIYLDPHHQTILPIPSKVYSDANARLLEAGIKWLYAVAPQKSTTWETPSSD